MSRRQFLSCTVLITLLVLTGGVYFYAALDETILDDGDALYASIAVGMEQSGDWVTPYVDGVRFLDKPPMLYWLMAIAVHCLGVTEFAVRLPAALAVLGVATLLFFMGKRAGDALGKSADDAPEVIGAGSGVLTGLVAGSVFALGIGTFLFTRQAFPDIFFVFFLTLAVAALFAWYRDARNPARPALVFYASLAGAVLSKGLIGLVFPLVILVGLLLWSGAIGRLRHFHIGKGTLLFLALAAPWHILVAHRNPGFLWYYFVNEHVLRFLGRRQPPDYESIPLLLFWALVLVWLFPWSAFLPALRHLRPKISWRGPRDPALQVGGGAENASADLIAISRISVVWALAVLVFFSFSSRIEHYALPIFPPLALLLAVALTVPACQADREARRQRSIARGFVLLAGIGVLALLGALTLDALWLGELTGGATTGTGAPRHLDAYRYYFAPLFDLPPETMARLRPPLLGTGALLALGLSCACWLGMRKRLLAAVLTINLVMMGLCGFTRQSLGICQDFISSRQFGEKLRQLYRPGDAVVVLGDFETANSINFYAPMPLYVYQGSAALLYWGLTSADAPPRLLTDAAFADRWAGARRTFLLLPEDRLATLRLSRARVVMRSAGRVLVCNL